MQCVFGNFFLFLSERALRRPPAAAGERRLMSDRLFSGITTLLPTPFEEDGRIDFFALSSLLEKQALAGNGVALFSPVSERAALSEKERFSILDNALDIFPGQMKIFVCLSSSGGENELAFAEKCASSGVDGFFADAENCFQKGFFLFVKRLSQACGKPIAVLRGDGRQNLPLFAELSSIDRVEAFAETGEKPAETDALFRAVSARGALLADVPYPLCAREELAFLSETLLCPGMLSVSSCLFPFEFADLWKKKGRARRDALARFASLFELFSRPSCAASVKWALHRLGCCLPSVRLPLTEPDTAERFNIERRLDDALHRGVR